MGPALENDTSLLSAKVTSTSHHGSLLLFSTHETFEVYFTSYPPFTISYLNIVNTYIYIALWLMSYLLFIYEKNYLY